MAQEKYEVTGPDGSVYEVEGPAGASDEEILAQVQASQGWRDAGSPVIRAPDKYLEAPTIGDLVAGTEDDRELSTRGSLLGAFGAAADGIMPNAARNLRGVRGTIDNAFGSMFGDEEFSPAEAFQQGAAEMDRVEGQFAEENPAWSDGLGWGGLGLGLALPGAAVARGARAASLSGGIANGAATGALYGGASGLLNAEGDGRLANGGMGALAGAVIGGAASPALRGIGQLASAARRNIPGVDAAASFIESIPSRISGFPAPRPNAAAQAQAERLLADEMGNGAVSTGMGSGTAPLTPQSILDEVTRRQSLGTPAMPADTNEQLRRMTSWALQGRGPMTSRAREVLSQRQAAAGGRIRQQVQDELGPAVDPIAETQRINDRVRAASAPGYQQAYSIPMVVTPEIEGIMRTPAFQDALPQAIRNIRNAQRDPTELGFRLDGDGSIESVETLTVEGFDQVIRAMRDAGRDAAKINPVTGRVENNTNSIHINERARNLRDMLGDQNDPYRTVTENYADEMAVRSALERGQEVGKLTGPEIAAQMRSMPDHAQEAWMAGARTSLADTATDKSLKPTANVAQQLRRRLGLSGAGLASSAGDTAKQEAIEAMSGRPGVMQRIDDRLENEDQAFKTFNESFGNSKTGSRRALDEAMDGGGALQTVANVASGGWAGAAADFILRGNPRGAFAYKQAVQERIAEIMTETNPQNVQELMAAVAQRAQTDADFGALLNRAGVDIARPAAAHFAGQGADPMVDETLEP